MPNRPPVFRPTQGHRPAIPDRRANAHRRGYGRAWRQVRLQVLREEPLCRDCLARGLTVPATDVDHIVAKPLGTDARTNLQALCHSCHSRKTMRHDAPARRA